MEDPPTVSRPDDRAQLKPAEEAGIGVGITVVVLAIGVYLLLKQRRAFQEVWRQFHFWDPTPCDIWDIPPSGVWKGKFREGRHKAHGSEIDLTFMEDGSFSGTGRDSQGDKIIMGKFNGKSGKIQWLETYDPSLAPSQDAPVLEHLKNLADKRLYLSFWKTHVLCTGVLDSRDQTQWKISGTYSTTGGGQDKVTLQSARVVGLGLGTDGEVPDSEDETSSLEGAGGAGEELQEMDLGGSRVSRCACSYDV